MNSARGETWVSPSLFANIFGDKLIKNKQIIIIFPSPFGPHPPSIPVAKATTVARVATPINVDRAFQANIFQALRDYFTQNRRLVKKGDIIAVRFDRNDLVCSQDDNRATADVNVKLEYKLSFCAFINGSISVTKSIPIFSMFENTYIKVTSYFVVTNLEYDIPVGMRGKELVDFHMECATGEYGCWIDPNVTKLVQAGVEHYPTPDLGKFCSLVISSRVNDDRLKRFANVGNCQQQQSLSKHFGHSRSVFAYFSF